MTQNEMLSHDLRSSTRAYNRYTPLPRVLLGGQIVVFKAILDLNINNHIPMAFMSNHLLDALLAGHLVTIDLKAYSEESIYKNIKSAYLRSYNNYAGQLTRIRLTNSDKIYYVAKNLIIDSDRNILWSMNTIINNARNTESGLIQKSSMFISPIVYRETNGVNNFIKKDLHNIGLSILEDYPNRFEIITTFPNNKLEAVPWNNTLSMDMEYLENYPYEVLSGVSLDLLTESIYE